MSSTVLFLLITKIAYNDPDAFDWDRVQDEGIEYVCTDADVYSQKLETLCNQFTAARNGETKE